ncbi:unnamed protein product [Schistosoma mattheei]|uniref:Peptidase M13 C-terminal domain-containing protein n=1 Tax=Schistosoma mattheei TaxID=31246 RepID=A0AA85BHI3_9TREM|nr:unnamed protein product [Schistosoma mattheei]
MMNFQEISITQGLHVSEFNEIISMKELKSICPQINWSYLLKELLKQTGYEKSKQPSIIVEGRYQLKHRCELYGDVMKTEKDKRSPLELPIFTTRAYYNMNANRVYMNAGVLQPPLYYENGSLASKFGALGWIISHEIMHGIGIQGVLFDSAGTSLTGLAGLMLSSVIETKASCISDQYRLYEFTDYKINSENTDIGQSKSNMLNIFYDPLGLETTNCDDSGYPVVNSIKKMSNPSHSFHPSDGKHNLLESKDNDLNVISIKMNVCMDDTFLLEFLDKI